MELPDVNDLKNIQEALKTAGHGIDFFKRFVPKITPPWKKAAGVEANEADSLAEVFYGKPSQVSEFNSKLRYYLNVRTQPFIIRIGEQISIPGSDSISMMTQSIEGPTVWDWHYVFDYPNMSSTDKQHLRDNFLNKNGEISKEISTTSLMLSRMSLPEHFQKGVFIFGLEATNLSYTNLQSIDKESLIPMRVLLRLNDPKPRFSVVSDPVAVRYWLNEVLEFVETVQSQEDPDGFEASLFCSGDLDPNGMPVHKERGLVPIANALR